MVSDGRHSSVVVVPRRYRDETDVSLPSDHAYHDSLPIAIVVVVAVQNNSVASFFLRSPSTVEVPSSQVLNDAARNGTTISWAKTVSSSMVDGTLSLLPVASP